MKRTNRRIIGKRRIPGIAHYGHFATILVWSPEARCPVETRVWIPKRKGAAKP